MMIEDDEIQLTSLPDITRIAHDVAFARVDSVMAIYRSPAFEAA